jgi:hypothetical protein
MKENMSKNARVKDPKLDVVFGFNLMVNNSL